MGHAVGLLTTQPAQVQDPGEPQDSGTSGSTWEGQKGTHGANNWPHLKAEKKRVWLSMLWVTETYFYTVYTPICGVALSCWHIEYHK